MGTDFFEISINFVKMVAIFLLMVQLVPALVWVERRGSAFIQNRFGPNRVGPLGLTQLLADAIKFIFKEEFIPSHTRKFLFYAAPVMSLIPGALAFGSIPLSLPFHVEAFELFGQTMGPYRFAFQSFEMNVGIVFVLGISSLGAYGMLTAGWASVNKYSVFGALRASAQMISYELALGLSIVGILMIYGTFDFADMIAYQTGPLTFTWLGSEMTIPFLPNWGIFYQPLGALLLFIAMFAETNRAPFDLPEAEAELVAGYHTEYGGLKMNMFYIGEYGHMMVASALMTTFYFGGYNLPFVEPETINEILLAAGFSATKASLLTSFTFFLVLFTKLLIFLWIFIWVRWTLPRFRYDQLMDLGWKKLLPWALGNTIVTAVVIFVMKTWS
ncbi:MAG: NADH-quinone oxidoreductase subunit H [Bdellovibrionaceae bacterium]|nr:NADH-quinone oxidoreductase subunit H [Pseudobdellovibrionaceae bacterium]